MKNLDLKKKILKIKKGEAILYLHNGTLFFGHKYV